MMKLVVIFFVAVLAVASAQLLYPGLARGISSEGIVQAHTPFAGSSYGRVQTHGGALLGLGYGYL
ncbi:hypothetical protein C0J52_25324 [Blattella germanica]|nr:hypothetical protein C0J52_25326 [Blattella germanica]PSN34181.1 hypothetical protein C0J52_25324 [Blattella germanica]